jgi:hypothetical protein
MSKELAYLSVTRRLLFFQVKRPRHVRMASQVVPMKKCLELYFHVLTSIRDVVLNLAQGHSKVLILTLKNLLEF